MNVVIYLASILIPWTSRTVLYHFAFRWRHIHATLQTKIIVAGAPMLVGALLPFLTSPILMFPLSIGVSLYLCKQFTDGRLFPDLVLVVVGIEIVNTILIDRLLMSILF